MMLQKVEQIVGIGGIIFAAGGGESLAILGQGGWIDRIGREEVVLQQRIEQWSRRLFETDTNGPTREALAQREGPLLQSLWRLFEDCLLPRSGARILETHGVAL